MKQASELTWVSPAYAVWQIYDPAIKADLSSTAVRTTAGIVIIDPIPLAAEARVELGEIAAVLVTNANHLRVAAEFADSIFLPPQLAAELPGTKNLASGTSVHGLSVIGIDGAAPDEFAFYDARDCGTLIVGDALINFGSFDFELLPAKYCLDRKQMIRSLRRLLDLPFVRMFFAHGVPITVAARDRLATLLEEFS
jgi:glyoxylase-like metal-dependent hydrolase (beta-lactamase superfamily II)